MRKCIPSVKTISSRLGGHPGLAMQIRASMETVTYSFHGANASEVFNAMQHIDKLLETHGVEYLTPTMGHCGWRGVDYCNAGDPYHCTVMFDWQTERFLVGNWGDLVERQPRFRA